MDSESRLIDVGSVRRMGSSRAALQIIEGPKSTNEWRGRRYLTLDSRNAFELTYWCGTCPFLFERMEGANQTLSIEELSERLNTGLDRADGEVLAVLSQLVPEGDYLPLLLEVQPRLIAPMRSGDYFSEDQVATWGIDSFWGLPQYPRTPYYRLGNRDIDSVARLFEFIVPMVPPSWNDPSRVDAYANSWLATRSPTCLAVAVLDICQPAVARDAVPEPGLAHWCLASFLVDGHHKVEAAARSSRSVRLFTLLALDHSIATRDEALRLPSLLHA